MNSLLITGSVIVTLALLSYSIGILIEQRKKILNSNVMLFMTLGIVLDITATIFMIVGSPNSPFTVHGFLGYSALLVMLIDVFLLWQYRINKGATEKVSKGLHLYSRYAYSWWVIAYITGSMLVVFK